MDGVPGVKSALKGAGMTSREYLLFSWSVFQNGMAAWALDQPGGKLPPGVKMANVNFYRAHEAELKRLGELTEEMVGCGHEKSLLFRRRTAWHSSRSIKSRQSEGFVRVSFRTSDGTSTARVPTPRYRPRSFRSRKFARALVGRYPAGPTGRQQVEKARRLSQIDALRSLKGNRGTFIGVGLRSQAVEPK
jgi:hypothetical protein